MAKLPRYQNVGVKPLAPPDFDYANLRESARFAQTLSQQVDRMNSFIAKEAEREAEQRGLSMVQEEGAQQVLKKFSGDKKPFTVAETTAYQAATRIASAEIETEARAEINRLISEAKINRTSFGDSEDEKGNFIPGVQSRLSEIVDGFPAALSDVDPVAAGLLRARLTDFATDKEIAYSEFYEKIKIQELQGKFIQNMSNAQLDIYEYAASENGTPDGIEKRINDFANNMKDLQINEIAISNWIIETRVNARKNGTIAEFQRLPDLSAKEDFLTNLEKTPLKELGVADTRTLVRSLRTEVTKAYSEIKSTASSLTSKIKEDIKIAESGGNVAPDRKNGYAAVLLQHGTKYPEYFADAKNEFVALDQTIKIMDSVRQMTPTDLTEFVNTSAQGLPGIGGEGRDTQQEQIAYEISSKFLETMNTQINKDPYSFAVRSGLVDFTPIKLDGSADDLRGSLRQRQNDIDLISNHYGVMPKIFTEAETTVISNIVNGDQRIMSFDGELRVANADDQMQIMAVITGSLGENANVAFEQIAPKNPEFAHIGGLYLLGNADAAKMALQGIELRKGGVSALGLDSEQPKAIFRQQVGNSLEGQGVSVYAAAVKVANAIYNKRAQAETMFDPELYAESVQMALNKNADGTGGIANINDQKVYLYPGLTDDDLSNMIDQITADDILQLTEREDQFGDIVASKIESKLLKDINDGEFILRPAPPALRQKPGDYILYRDGGAGGLILATDTDNDPLVINALDWKTSNIAKQTENVRLSLKKMLEKKRGGRKNRRDIK
jgi:hypothetical protein